MTTPPAPGQEEIPPFTAEELAQFESSWPYAAEDSEIDRLCALARRGLEADKLREDLAKAVRQRDEVTARLNAAAPATLPGPSGESWVEVTHQLGERVARLEVTSQLVDMKSGRSKPHSFADIGKSPWFQRLATDGIMRDFVNTDRYLRALLGPDEYEESPPQPTDLPPDPPQQTDGATITISVDHWERAWSAHIGALPSLDLEVCLARIAAQHEAGEREAIETVAGLRLNLEQRRLDVCAALGLATGAHGASWESLIAQIDRLERARLDAEVFSASPFEREASWRAAKELSAAMNFLQDPAPWDVLVEAAKLLQQRSDDLVEVQQVFENLGGRGVIGASTHAAERARAVLEGMVRMRGEIQETERQLANARADNANIRSTREAIAQRVTEFERQLAVIGEAHWKGVELHRETGGSVPGDLPPVRTELVRWLLTRLEDEKRERASHDVARRLRDSEFIRGHDAEWLEGVTDDDIANEFLRRASEATAAESELANVASVVPFEELGRVRMMGEGPLADRVIAAIGRARQEGRREADVERAALVAKLQLVREALGATLQPDGTDDVVDKARASASREVPEILDRELEWYGAVATIASRMDISCPGTPEVAREALWADIYKLQRDLETERKIHAENLKHLTQSNADHNALLAQLHRIREAMSIKIGTPWQQVADDAIGCVRVIDEELDAVVGPLPGEPSPRPGHARVQISIWPSAADRPMFDRPEYGVSLDLGVEAIAEFQVRAARAIAMMLTRWEQPDALFAPSQELDLAEALESDRKIASSLDPGRFALDIAARLDERRPAAEQILRDVIAAARASGAEFPAGGFEIRNRAASGQHPPCDELHVLGQGAESTTDHVLAYVELGQLHLITLPEERSIMGCSDYELLSSPFLQRTTPVNGSEMRYRWPDRIAAALARKS